MRVILNKEKHENKRLFSVYLKLEDTLKILDSPHFLTGNTFDVYFQLADRGELTEPVFRLEHGTPEIYVMYGKTGFKTNAEHLDYLINLGPIPMVFSENNTCVGYVKIENQDLYIQEQVKKLRSLANLKETRCTWEKRYGNNMSTCNYYKDGNFVGKIYKTNKEINYIQIGEEGVF